MKLLTRNILIFSLVFCMNGLALIAQEQDKYYGVRQRMISDQIVVRGIKDRKVIKAMLDVERHRFVPNNYERMAYEDRPLPIGEGQTISQPYIVALMTETLNLSKDMKVLEIGTGSGYQAAILGELCDEVYSIEIYEVLGNRAKELLEELGYENIEVKIGDGYIGWSEHAPFDAIIVTCAPSDIPQPLKDQLAEGGRMIIPVGGSLTQELVLLEKIDGKLKEKTVAPVRFVPMIKENGKRY